MKYEDVYRVWLQNSVVSACGMPFKMFLMWKVKNRSQWNILTAVLQWAPHVNLKKTGALKNSLNASFYEFQSNPKGVKSESEKRNTIYTDTLKTIERHRNTSYFLGFHKNVWPLF